MRNDEEMTKKSRLQCYKVTNSNRFGEVIHDIY